MSVSGRIRHLRTRVVPALTGPPALAFLPALTLGAFWIGGEVALMLTSLGLPLVFAAAGSFSRHAAQSPALPRDAVTGLLLRDGFDACLAQIWEETRAGDLRSACLVLEMDEIAEIAARHGQEAADSILRQCGDRIQAVLREDDVVTRTAQTRFAICLAPVRQLDLELCIQLSGRLQSSLENAYALDGMSLYLSCSVGFCLRSRAPGRTAAEWLQAGEAALADARVAGPSVIRAFSLDIQRRSRARGDLLTEVASALEGGQIEPWFQPQISTDTGRVTGFEALARWNHPKNGLILPADFLPALEQAGLSERLGQLMLYHALTALKAWDMAAAEVPRIGVNFSPEELRSPGLVDRVQWELDRFELAPDRLSVEVLETVVTDAPEDIITRNIRGLCDLGCRIDLDDFGTGHASIASLRRFPVSRLKIDRSFVAKADRDPEQQRMIGAILTMAERLEVETLAEGVETVGEHALLAQLGCDHVQGFGIGAPMPFNQTLDWIARHRAKLVDAPVIGRDVG